MSIHSEGKSWSISGRALILNDPPAQGDASVVNETVATSVLELWQQQQLTQLQQLSPDLTRLMELWQQQQQSSPDDADLATLQAQLAAWQNEGGGGLWWAIDTAITNSNVSGRA